MRKRNFWRRYLSALAGVQYEPERARVAQVKAEVANDILQQWISDEVGGAAPHVVLHAASILDSYFHP